MRSSSACHLCIKSSNDFFLTCCPSNYLLSAGLAYGVPISTGPYFNRRNHFSETNWAFKFLTEDVVLFFVSGLQGLYKSLLRVQEFHFSTFKLSFILGLFKCSFESLFKVFLCLFQEFFVKAGQLVI